MYKWVRTQQKPNVWWRTTRKSVGVIKPWRSTRDWSICLIAHVWEHVGYEPRQSDQSSKLPRCLISNILLTAVIKPVYWGWNISDPLLFQYSLELISVMRLSSAKVFWLDLKNGKWQNFSLQLTSIQQTFTDRNLCRYKQGAPFKHEQIELIVQFKTDQLILKKRSYFLRNALNVTQNCYNSETARMLKINFKFEFISWPKKKQELVIILANDQPWNAK